MKKIIVTLLLTAFVLGALWLLPSIRKNNSPAYYPQSEKYFWKVQSVDTMKYSRDVAYEKLEDATFDAEIERQIRAIAGVGATHAAIGTPYDEKFFPFLKRWADMARRYGLKVWFRGNWSGWEGWFGYPKNMTRAEHLQKTKEFIARHADIFADGDIFSACPECENGGPGDPRLNNDAAGHRQFLKDEYAATREAFAAINKKVESNYFSMNGDVARLIMNKETTRALDGIVVIDHYVPTPKQLAEDIHSIALQSGGKVVLGEWGVAIPDIHGKMNEEARAEWVENALKAMLALDGDLAGMNYWLAVGGGTELWPQGMETSKVSEVLKKYYDPKLVYGRVTDELSRPISGAKITFGGQSVFSDNNGNFKWRGVEWGREIETAADGYASKKMPASDSFQNIALVNKNPGLFFKISLWLKKIFN